VPSRCLFQIKMHALFHMPSKALCSICVAANGVMHFWRSFGCAFFIMRVMKMASFFIDFENLSGRTLEGISLIQFEDTDEILIFHSKNLLKISLQLHKELEKIKAKK